MVRRQDVAMNSVSPSPLTPSKPVPMTHCTWLPAAYQNKRCFTILSYYISTGNMTSSQTSPQRGNSILTVYIFPYMSISVMDFPYIIWIDILSVYFKKKIYQLQTKKVILRIGNGHSVSYLYTSLPSAYPAVWGMQRDANKINTNLRELKGEF